LLLPRSSHFEVCFLQRALDEQLGAIRVETMRREGVLDAKLMADSLDSWTNSIVGDSGASGRLEYERLGEANEWDGRLLT